MKLVISDAHEGVGATAAEVLALGLLQQDDRIPRGLDGRAEATQEEADRHAAAEAGGVTMVRAQALPTLEAMRAALAERAELDGSSMDDAVSEVSLRGIATGPRTYVTSLSPTGPDRRCSLHQVAATQRPDALRRVREADARHGEPLH